MASETPLSDNVQPKTPERTLRSRFAFVARKLAPFLLFLAAGVTLVILVGVAQRLGWIQSGAPIAVSQRDGDPTTYTCPMHPQIRQPTPGRCPICGMALEPVSTAASSNLDEFSVEITPAQRRLANIQTAAAEVAPLQATLQTVGAIAIDESRQATIAAYIAGRIERLFADYTGIQIQKGDHLAIIYSPQLYAAQVEYHEARRALGAAAGVPAMRQVQQTLVANTRTRLREFGMTNEQLTELERLGTAQSRLTIYAPQGGTVVEKLAVEGNYVEAGDPIYRIAELSTVWLMLELFPEDATKVRFGQRVEARVQSMPGEMLIGRVAFIDPTVDPSTRTVGVRVELMNDGRLRPGDYAEATITLPIGPQGSVYDADLAGKWISPMHPQIIRDEPGHCPICGMDLVPTAQYGFADEPVPQPESLYVPRTAVLLAGGNSVVYVETDPGVFEIRPVTVGPILRDKIVVLKGLKAGEHVATAGNFLIDSQMQLAGKPSLIDPTRAVAKAQQRKGPLEFEHTTAAPLAGEAGATLDRLYTAYFQIQQALAADQVPADAPVQTLYAAAKQLSDHPTIAQSDLEQLQEIAAHAEHLHHLELEEARKSFKPISHAVVTIAARLRSAGAHKPLYHFYCPMVPGGGGDWLQADAELLNPYFGSKMLRCGEKVHTFSAPGDQQPANDPTQHQHHPAAATQGV